MTNKLKEIRQANELTQAQLAERVQVSRQTIISIENNRYTPSVLLALKIAQSLQKKVEQIFFVDDRDS